MKIPVNKPAPHCAEIWDWRGLQYEKIVAILEGSLIPIEWNVSCMLGLGES